jgi:hypothetical protein
VGTVKKSIDTSSPTWLSRTFSTFERRRPTKLERKRYEILSTFSELDWLLCSGTGQFEWQETTEGLVRALLSCFLETPTCAELMILVPSWCQN